MYSKTYETIKSLTLPVFNILTSSKSNIEIKSISSVRLRIASLINKLKGLRNKEINISEKIYLDSNFIITVRLFFYKTP